jgi:hypothetical protein
MIGLEALALEAAKEAAKEAAPPLPLAPLAAPLIKN